MNPVEVQERLEATAESLDNLSKGAAKVYEMLDEIEAEWDAHRDTIGEELKEQMVAEQRKGDPPDHWVTSVSRRRRPELYAAYRKARRLVARFEIESSNRRSELTGYQSLLRTEAAMTGVQGGRPGLPVHGRRRAS